MPTVSSNRVIPREQLTAWERWELAALAEAELEKRQGRGAMNAHAQPQHQHAEPAVDAAAIAAEAAKRGFEEGRKAGYAAGQEDAKNEAARLAQLADAAAQAVDALGGDIAVRTAELALAIARQVVRSEIDTNPESVLAVLREALAAMPATESRVTIAVHPDDAELVRAHAAEDPTLGEWRVSVDPSVGRTGVRIVTAGGDVDATLATRWKHVIAAFSGTES